MIRLLLLVVVEDVVVLLLLVVVEQEEDGSGWRLLWLTMPCPIDAWSHVVVAAVVSG